MIKQGDLDPHSYEDLNFLRVHSSVHETTASHKKVIFEVTVPKHVGG